MGAIIYTNGNFQGVDDNGEYIANGTIIFNNFLDGTPAQTYKDSLATISNPYEIPLSSSGKADVYLTGGEYVVILKDSNGTIVRTIPRFIPFLGNSGGTNYAIREEFNATAGQTEFTLTDIPTGTSSLYINGLLQPSTVYSVSANVIMFNPALTLNDKVIFDYSTATSGGGSGSTQIVLNERNSVLDYGTIELELSPSNKIKVIAGKRITQCVGFNDFGQVDTIEILQGELVDISLLSPQVGQNYLYKKLNGVYELEPSYVYKFDRNTMVGTAVYLGEFDFDGTVITFLEAAVPTIFTRDVDGLRIVGTEVNAQDISAAKINDKTTDILVMGRLDGTTLYLSNTTTDP